MRFSVAFEPYAGADEVLDWLNTRYGVASTVFEGHRFWCRPGAPAIWIAAMGCVPPEGLELEAHGVMVMRKPPPAGKLTSVFMQCFMGGATRNVVDLSDEALRMFLRREAQPAPDTVRGYVVVRGAGQVIGAGLARNGLLEPELPRSWLEALRL